MRKGWRTRFGGVLVCSLMLAGCARAHVVQVPPLQAPVACQTVVPERDVLAGVSLSGGGSRAALCGAAGLEALAGLRTADGTSALEHVALLSSVVSADGRSPKIAEIGSPPTTSKNVSPPTAIGRRAWCWDWRTS
jgi:hypothetical protein